MVRMTMLFAALTIVAGSFATDGRAEVLERVCRTSEHDPQPLVLRIDTDAPSVMEGGHAIRNGPAKPLGEVTLFVTVDEVSIAWGARNTRAAMTYFRYEFDMESNTLTYEAGRLRTKAACTAQHSDVKSRPAGEQTHG